MRAFFVFLILFFPYSSCFAVFDGKEKEEKPQDIAPVDHLSVLPVEIITHISSFLSIFDIGRWAQTNRDWHKLIMSILNERICKEGFTYDGRKWDRVVFPSFLFLMRRERGHVILPSFLFSFPVTILHLSYLSSEEAQKLNRILGSNSQTMLAFFARITDLAIECSDLGSENFLPNVVLPNLVRLTVAGNRAAPGICEDFIHRLLTPENALRLTSLNLANQPSGSEALYTLIDRCQSDSPTLVFPNLIEFNIAGNALSRDNAALQLMLILKRYLHLVRFNIEGIGISPQRHYVFFTAMCLEADQGVAALSTRLVSLNAGHCPQSFAPNSLNAFLNEQRGFYPALEHLNFSGNALGPANISLLLRFLIQAERFPALRELHLGGNNAGAEGTRVLQESIERQGFANLIDLNFSSNNAGQALEGVMRSIRRSTMPHLVFLNVADNRIAASVIEGIIEEISSSPQFNQTLPLGLSPQQNIHYENNDRGLLRGMVNTFFIPFRSFF